MRKSDERGEQDLECEQASPGNWEIFEQAVIPYEP